MDKCLYSRKDAITPGQVALIVHCSWTDGVDYRKYASHQRQCCHAIGEHSIDIVVGYLTHNYKQGAGNKRWQYEAETQGPERNGKFRTALKKKKKIRTEFNTRAHAHKAATKGTGLISNIDSSSILLNV